MPLLILVFCFSSILYATTDIKILPIPSDQGQNIELPRLIDAKDALVVGLKHNVELINSRESLTDSTNSLSFAFESWQPQLGEFSASYTISPSSESTLGYPQGVITLPSLTQKFPTGTSVTINPPSYTTVRRSYALAYPPPEYRGTYGFGSPTLTITQNLLQGSNIDVNLASLKTSIISNLLEKINVIEKYNSTAKSILQSFRTLQLEHEKVKVFERTEEKLKTAIEVVRSEMEGGTKNKLDLSEKELTLKKFEIDRKTAEQNLIEQKNSFIDLIGMSSEKKFDIKSPNIKQIPQLKDLQHYIKIAEKHNLTLRTHQLNTESAHLTLLQNQDQARWNLSASATLSAYGKNSNSGSLSLSVPVQQTSNNNQITSSRIKLFNSKRTYNKYKDYVRSTTKSKYEKLKNRIESFKISEQRVTLSHQVTKITTLKYEQGSINALHHSEQLESHINAITNHIDAWAAMMNEYDSLLDFCGLLLKSYDIRVSDPSMNYDNYAEAIMPHHP